MFMHLQKKIAEEIQTKINDSDSPENITRGGQDSVSEYIHENLCPIRFGPFCGSMIDILSTDLLACETWRAT